MELGEEERRELLQVSGGGGLLILCHDNVCQSKIAKAPAPQAVIKHGNGNGGAGGGVSRHVGGPQIGKGRHVRRGSAGWMENGEVGALGVKRRAGKGGSA